MQLYICGCQVAYGTCNHTRAKKAVALIENTVLFGAAKSAYSVEQAAQLLGLSRGTTYLMVRERRIPSIRFGRRILIPRLALERLLAETTDA